MSDNNNNNSETIPSFVGQYTRRRDEKIPKIVVIDYDSDLTQEEKRLTDFFKCTVNWKRMQAKDKSMDTSDHNLIPCRVSRQTINSFYLHLTQKHKSLEKLFCVYCYDSLSSSSLKKYETNYLLRHMFKRHRFRRFQCSLCRYRAITEEHVIVHQKRLHHKEYKEALRDNGLELTNKSVCKVFVCPKVTDCNRNLFYYFNKYKTNRFNYDPKNKNCYQCLYCSDFTDEDLQKVVYHCVERHPDYPLLYYIPEAQVTISSSLVELPNTRYDKVIAIRVKQEPQDNSVSSTQRSPEINCSNETNDYPIPQSTQETESLPNRVTTESSGSRIRHFSERQEPNIQKKKICLFCDKEFDVESDEAKTHLESHFTGSQLDRCASDWIQTFLNKQWSLSSFTDSTSFQAIQNSEKSFYLCPICKKLAKIHNRFPNYYYNYRDVRNHFYQHCCWLSAQCTLRICMKSFPNFDPSIAEHFNNDSSHAATLKQTKYKFLSTAGKDPNRIRFSNEDRKTLEKLISIKQNPVIDKCVNQLLQQILENYLRDKHKCNERSVKPIVKLKPIPKHKFDELKTEFDEYERWKRSNQPNEDNDHNEDTH